MVARPIVRPLALGIIIGCQISYPLSTTAALIRTGGASFISGGLSGLIAYWLTSDKIIDYRYGNAYATIDPLRKGAQASKVARLVGVMTLMVSGLICAYQTPYGYFSRARRSIVRCEAAGMSNICLRSDPQANFFHEENMIMLLREERNTIQHAICLLLLAQRDASGDRRFIQRCNALIQRACMVRRNIDEVMIFIKTGQHNQHKNKVNDRDNYNSARS